VAANAGLKAKKVSTSFQPFLEKKSDADPDVPDVHTCQRPKAKVKQ
jgi:hypothetical protein